MTLILLDRSSAVSDPRTRAYLSQDLFREQNSHPMAASSSRDSTEHLQATPLSRGRPSAFGRPIEEEYQLLSSSRKPPLNSNLQPITFTAIRHSLHPTKSNGDTSDTGAMLGANNMKVVTKSPKEFDSYRRRPYLLALSGASHFAFWLQVEDYGRALHIRGCNQASCLSRLRRTSQKIVVVALSSLCSAMMTLFAM